MLHASLSQTPFRCLHWIFVRLFVRRVSICFSFWSYNFRSSMKRRWLTFPRRSRNWYPAITSVKTIDLGISPNPKVMMINYIPGICVLFSLFLTSVLFQLVLSFIFSCNEAFSTFFATTNIIIHLLNRLPVVYPSNLQHCLYAPAIL